MPYAMHRWLTLPYTKAFWDSYLLYMSALVVVMLSIANILLLLSFRWTRIRLGLLKGIAILLFILLFFPVIMGGLNAYYGSHAWLDALVLAVLYGNIQWVYKIYQDVLSSSFYGNDNL